ncbi:MAG: nucleotidyltransferase domain-containing protein [Planctomycetota bacterium]|nr:MAG: nucleotidyltransferase domain-containing protein [Planctomycetota bacterium]
MSTKKILEDFRKRLTQLYGKRLSAIILYGSQARGDADEDSDIDVLVVIRGKVAPGREIDRMIDIITDINLKYDTLISVYPVSEKDYRAASSPLLMNVQREGVVVWKE